MLTVIAFSILSSPAAHSDGYNFSLGKSQYKQGNYQRALSYFDDTLKESPRDVTALYYRANTLLALGLKRQALSDYQQAYILAEPGMLHDYCLKAISSLIGGSNLTPPKASPAQTLEEIRKQDELEQSLGAIQLQNAMNKVIVVDSSELSAGDAIMKRRAKLAQEKRETQDMAESMQNSVYYDRNGIKQQRYSTTEIQSFLDQRHQQEQSDEDDLNKFINQQTQFAQERANFTQDSAINLATQLKGGNSPDGIKLDPLGTNLYVRNYDSTNSSDPDPLPTPPTTQQKKKKHRSNSVYNISR